MKLHDIAVTLPWLGLMALSAQGCALEPRDAAPAGADLASENQALYMQTDHLWADTNIKVCWIGSNGNTFERKVVRDAVTVTWQAHANVQFSYWGRCSDDLTNVIRIETDHDPNESTTDDDCTNCSQVIGNSTRNADWGVRLDLNADEYWLRRAAIHEFGHVLGAWHEQMRPSNQFAAQCDRFQGASWYDEITLLNGLDSSKAKEVTGFDPWSVMNYCTPANPLQLSRADVRGIGRQYGSRKARSRLWVKGSARELEIGGDTTLRRYESWTSVNGSVRATMNADGSLAVFRVNGRVDRSGATVPVQIWNTPTVGTDGSQAVFQSDGNLVIRNDAGQPLWSSDTWNHPNSRLVMQNDGNLVIYEAGSNNSLWSSGTEQIDELNGAGLMRAGFSLSAGDVLTTESRNFSLEMQTDGNLVAYDASRGVVWSADTYGSGATKATMQADGNLVITTAAGNVVYATGTHGHTGAYLALQENGQVVIHEPSKYEVWSNGSMGDTFVPTFTTGTPILQWNEQLTRGQSRQVGSMQLVMQNDGNLVLYNGTTATWSTRTHGTGATHVDLQLDGNMVVYDDNGNAKWSSKTNGYRSSILTLTPEGRLSLFRLNVNGLY